MDVIILIFQWLLTLCLPVILFLYWYVNRNHSYWKNLGVPYEKPIPFIGNLNFALRTSVFEYFKSLKDCKDDYFGIYLGATPALVIQTPELAKRILVKDFDSFQDRYNNTTHKDRLGQLNLFSVKGPFWQKMRQELSPMFTSSRMKSLIEYMNVNSKYFAEKIQRDHVDNNKAVNLKEVGTMFAADTVAYNVFGLRVSALTGDDSPMSCITDNMTTWNLRRGFEITSIFLLPTLAKLLGFEFFSTAASQHIKDLFRGVLKLRSSTMHATDKDLVNHLQKMKENFKLPSDNNAELTEDLMMAQIAVFILGSVETSAATLAFCMHELAYHPEEQEKLYNAVREAHEKCGKDILGYEELTEVKYLSQCLNETMRKYPLLAYLDRVCNKDYKLDEKLIIKKGTPVLVNVMAMHFSEQYYPEPNEWRPERMETLPDSNVFYGFGNGPRFCIGKRYGMLQISAAMAQIIKKFRILPEPGVSRHLEIDPYSIITSPKSGVVVKFELR